LFIWREIGNSEYGTAFWLDTRITNHMRTKKLVSEKLIYFWAIGDDAYSTLMNGALDKDLAKFDSLSN
jgi:hypothetical protein